MTYVIQAIESIKGALKWTKLYFLIYVRPVVEWLNTAVSKTADPGFESQSGDVRQIQQLFFISMDDKLLFYSNESPFESDEKTTVLYIGCMGESGLIHHSAKVATGDRPMVRIHLHPLKT